MLEQMDLEYSAMSHSMATVPISRKTAALTGMALNSAREAILKAFPKPFGTILIDPPWRFANRTGKMAPEHKRLHRYPTMSFEEIGALPVREISAEKSHLYLWCPNALLAEALSISVGVPTKLRRGRS